MHQASGFISLSSYSPAYQYTTLLMDDVISQTQGRRHVLNFRGPGNLLKTLRYILLSEISLGLHVCVNMTSHCKINLEEIRTAR